MLGREDAYLTEGGRMVQYRVVQQACWARSHP